MGIISVNFDATYQLLIIYYAFVKYFRKNGNTRLFIDFKKAYDSVRREIKGKGKAVPLQTSTGPVGSRKLRFPELVTTAQGWWQVVSLMHRPPLPPGNTPGTHFC